ncbi:hypothetical protein CLOACE_19870 [Clostridium acetireducens DSM 10703]|jgi:hypothetical protein|uniref:Uncharacterized protein n=1 Tax=Clostridium acetireducens DSM 10703 TaxID=1121290 RepID=A0A1E8EX80_9CLOT|nr:hypothetical protein [Clostridium acetireducens]OFI04973.1 hypothetical protein CLOACE_19870 [Clostridium acetireducens DSM 10703]
MLSIEKKMIVADSCLEYEPKNEFFMYSGILPKSCANCVNYRDSQCSKDLFNNICNNIEKN